MTRRTLFASIAALFGARKAAAAAKPPLVRWKLPTVAYFDHTTRTAMALRLPRVLHPGGAYNPKNWTTDVRIPVNRVEVLNQKLWNDHMDQQARSIGVSMDALTRSILQEPEARS